MTFALLLISQLSAVTPIATPNPDVEKPCGAVGQQAEVRLANLLSAARRFDVPGTRIRELAGIAPADLRLLDNEIHTETCQRVRDLALAGYTRERSTGQPWLVSVYEGGGYYFAVVSSNWTPPPRDPVTGAVTIRTGGGGWLAVYDTDFRYVIHTRG